MRALLVSIIALPFFTIAAHATGEIVCSGDDGAVSIILNTGSAETLAVNWASIAIGDDVWSTIPETVPGSPLAVAHTIERDGLLLVEFSSGPAAPVIASLRSFSATEGDMSASGGILAFNGKGVWVVDCSEPE